MEFNDQGTLTFTPAPKYNQKLKTETGNLVDCVPGRARAREVCSFPPLPPFLVRGDLPGEVFRYRFHLVWEGRGGAGALWSPYSRFRDLISPLVTPLSSKHLER